MSLTMTTLACSAPELAYLTALAGAGPVLGFPDPFEGWLAAEVEEALWQARGALQERGLIQVAPDGRVTTTPEVTALVCKCGSSTASLQLNLEGGATHQYHLTPSLAVMVTLDKDQVKLHGLEGARAVKEQVLAAFDLTGQKAPMVTEGVTFESERLRRAHELAEESGAQAANHFLAQAGVPAETAHALATTLAGLQGHGTLLGFRRTDTGWQADGLGFLKGRGGLWLLEPEGAQVRVTPSTVEVMTAALTTWVDKLASAG